MTGRRLLATAIVTTGAILSLLASSTSPHTGPNTITVRAVDAAGNRSAPSTGPSTTNVVPGYPC